MRESCIAEAPDTLRKRGHVFFIQRLQTFLWFMVCCVFVPGYNYRAAGPVVTGVLCSVSICDLACLWEAV